MKLFEIGLAIVIVAIISGYVTGFFSKRKGAGILHAVGAILLVLHLAIEEYREHMILIYVTYLICVLCYGVNVVRRGKSAGRVRSKLWKRIVVGFLGLALVTAGLAVPLYLLPKVKLLLPTGTFAVGTANYHWVDKSREESFTVDQSDYREVIAKVWYPAEIGDDAELAPYAYTAEERRLVGKNVPFFKKALVSSISDVKSHSYWKAPVSSQSEKYPVLLFSPGYGASNYMYASILENLASHGYIIIAMQHPYFTMLPALFPDNRVAVGEIEPATESVLDTMDKQIAIWTQDALYILNQLEQWNNHETGDLLSGKMDLSKIGMFGHSFGGAASAQVMNEDNRILAGVNIDGTFFGKRIENGLSNPFLYLRSSESAADSSSIMTKEEYYKLVSPEEGNYEEYINIQKETILRSKGVLRNGGTEQVIDNITHQGFSEAVQFFPKLGKYNSSAIIQTNKVLLQYFDNHVKTAQIK
ncbi:hypothetical protein I6N90_06680 [Paenibacillus sp. GSMTC-2017]|uniref:alpha/beta hydrolase family protein n=1 Tax=Paenibacillus sp. GSMTC-2017 TaxID=2794350 RepID=UPI0018D9D04A|nr:hypothetical protein [Paenibacillus sp. GSMTC-2017]MBH5317500.1 hypothetical protein [Paenibacillus sp. GSMTC-2017]